LKTKEIAAFAAENIGSIEVINHSQELEKV
jgi:hypothetical protein